MDVLCVFVSGIDGNVIVIVDVFLVIDCLCEVIGEVVILGFFVDVGFFLLEVVGGGLLVFNNEFFEVVDLLVLVEIG